jgi:hypothetical protein
MFQFIKDYGKAIKNNTFYKIAYGVGIPATLGAIGMDGLETLNGLDMILSVISPLIMGSMLYLSLIPESSTVRTYRSVRREIIKTGKISKSKINMYHRYTSPMCARIGAKMAADEYGLSDLLDDKMIRWF